MSQETLSLATTELVACRLLMISNGTIEQQNFINLLD